MTNLILSLLWGVYYIVCAVLGFFPNLQNTAGGLLTGLSILFFLPPALLLYTGYREKNMANAAAIRILSAVSLGATLVVLVANFLSIRAEAWVGDVLYVLLILVSSPMVACGNWIISLFLWACLLCTSHSMLKKK